MDQITFDDYTKSEKKILKKWQQYPELCKVVITENYDSLKIINLLTAISMNKNIDELHISFGKAHYLKLAPLDFSHIKILKIYNSPYINIDSFNTSIIGLDKLQTFSWINNRKAINLNMLNKMTQINQLEFIDTQINCAELLPYNVLTNLYSLTRLTVSFNDISNLNIQTKIFKNDLSLSLININNYKNNITDIELLNTSELATHSINLLGKVKTINYCNNKDECTEYEKNEIVKKVGLLTNQIIENIVSKDEKGTKTNNERIEPIAKNDLVNDSNYFKRPIESLKIENTIISISGLKDTLLKFENGTQITIPSNTFINKKGEVISAGIDISYREFNTPLSIFASGIPMSTNIDGKAETLTSAGMFEIKAYKNNEELQIRNGKSIEVNFASIDDGKKYNFYEFDKTKKEWVDQKIDLPKTNLDSSFIYKNKLEISNTVSQVLNNNVLSYVENINTFDTTNFNDRFADFNYFFLSTNNKKSEIKYATRIFNPKTKLFKSKRYETSYFKLSGKKNLVKFHHISRSNTDTLKSLIFNLT